MKGASPLDLFSANELPSLVALFALAFTIGWLLWRSHRYLARQDKAWAPPARPARRAPHGDAPHGHAPQRSAPDDLVRWEVEMHDTARELSGQLESRMSALAHLIREADRAAARLEAALGSTGEPGQRESGSQTDQGEPLNSSDRIGTPPLQPTNQAEALKSPGGGDREPAPREAAAKPIESNAGGKRPAGDQRYEEVYLLADYGFEAAEIAHRVGSPVGEIELILALRER
jgi:hypothetical protein